MSGLQILTLFLYVPGAVWITIALGLGSLYSYWYPSSMPAENIPWWALPVALFEWTILFATFAGLAYIVGNMIPSRKKRSAPAKI